MIQLRNIRKKIKRLSPVRVIQCYDISRVYLTRLFLWLHVVKEIRGVNAAEKRKLQKSLLFAPFLKAFDVTIWYPILMDDTQVDVKHVGCFALRSNCDDLGHVIPSHEKAVFDKIRKLLKPNDCFVDAGANIGFYSILAGKLIGSQGSVIAVEMIPDTAERLRRNIALNHFDHVRVVESALYSEAGDVITANLSKDRFGQASIVHSPNANQNHRKITVQTTTLDSILDELPFIKCIKIDLEGAELQALQGAKKTLAKTAYVIFEQLSYDSQVISFLQQQGFVISPLDTNNQLAFNTAFASRFQHNVLHDT